MKAMFLIMMIFFISIFGCSSETNDNENLIVSSGMESFARNIYWLDNSNVVFVEFNRNAVKKEEQKNAVIWNVDKNRRTLIRHDVKFVCVNGRFVYTANLNKVITGKYKWSGADKITSLPLSENIPQKAWFDKNICENIPYGDDRDGIDFLQLSHDGTYLLRSKLEEKMESDEVYIVSSNEGVKKNKIIA